MAPVLTSKQRTLANTVTVEQNALVDASSVKNGNGGEINIWSLVQTNVAGILKAMGGAKGGNGGFIETSSIGILNIAQTAIVNVTAALGKVGMWLLYPEDMVITSSTATAISNAAATANVTIAVDRQSQGRLQMLLYLLAALQALP
jgi:mucin-19